MKKSGEWTVLKSEKNMLKFTEKFSIGSKHWQHEFVDYILSLTKNNRTFIDAGANYGFVTTAVADHFNHVHSFELIPETYECLNINVQNYSNVKTYNFGLGDKDAVVWARRKKRTAGHSQIINNKDWLNYIEKHNQFPKPHLYDIYKLPIKPLDSFKITDVDLIKIDVEGYEEYVLQGAVETLTNSKPVIALEICRPTRSAVERGFTDCIDFLDKLGYKLINQIGQDYFFIPR